MSDEHDNAAIVRRVETAPTGMSPVVVAVLARNPDAATLRECLAIQREYDAEEARKLYVVAFHGLKRDLPRILAHDKAVDFNTTHFTHTTIGAAVDAVVPHLVNHGFTHDWRPGVDDKGQVVVTCRLTHIGGHFEEVTLKAAPDTKGSKTGPQAVLSTATTLKRATLLDLLGIATKKMDEIEGGDREDGGADEPPPDEQIDTRKNMACANWLVKQGKTREAAEKHVDLPMTEWKQAHRDKLRDWATPRTDQGR